MFCSCTTCPWDRVECPHADKFEDKWEKRVHCRREETEETCDGDVTRIKKDDAEYHVEINKMMDKFYAENPKYKRYSNLS